MTNNVKKETVVILALFATRTHFEERYRYFYIENI